MRGRYGERISIYSEDLSVPTQENEFRFCTSHFYNQGWNWTWKNNLLFCNRERQASVSIPPERWIFITRFIPVEPKFLSLIGKLSVRDNQLFMNWYGKPIGSLLRSESISVLPITLSQLQMDLSIQKWNIYFLLSENLRLHGPFIWVLIMLQKTLVKVGSKPMQWELTVSWKQQLKKTVLTTLTLRTTVRENEWFKRWMIRVILLIIYNAVIRTQKCAEYS